MRYKRFPFILFCLLSSFAFALPSDQVSSRSWVMTVLGSLSAKGLTGMPSRLLFADGTYSRLETASIVKTLLDNAKNEPWDFSDEDLFCLDALLKEFSTELKNFGIDAEKAREDLELSYYKGIFLGGRFSAAFHHDDEKNENESRFLYRISSMMPVGDGFAFLSASNERRWLSPKPADFPYTDSAIIRYPFWDANWEIGRGYVRLGPGYIGSLWLGDSPPPYDYFLVSKDFKVGKWGWFNLKQFHTTYKSQGIRRYFIARRLEKSTGSWDFGVYEVHISDQFPSIFAFLPILPLYAVEHFWENDYNVNIVVGLEAARNFPKGSFYVDWFIDDITTFPYHVPRKTAILLGCRRDFSPFTLRLEYVYIDRTTYTHKDPNDDYLYKGYLMGYPLGPDSKGLFARFEFSKKLPLILQIGQTTSDKSLPNSEKTTSFSVLIPYDFGLDKSLSLLVAPYRKEAGGRVDRGINWELRAEYDF
ncbi:MAG: hypothetical protein ACP5KZ_01685 [bacterium]